MKNKLLKNLKVLLVEDEENIANLFKNTIGDNFYKFYLSKDGLEALEKFDKFCPDIVITDINMPKLNGLDMAKKIKIKNKDIPIIILSAFSEKEKLFSAIDIGIIKYFLKPYDPDEILSYILEIAPELGLKKINLVDDFVFNKTNSSLYKNNRFISLSKNELKFLLLMMNKKDEIVDEISIKLSIWQEQVSDDRLRTFIKRFRLKTSKNLIQNIKSRGYKLNIKIY
ncbi:MAG: DNA-binding response regulator [Sulfurimonas sp.]|nr:MAG: DNA-binding response regulator [Sulfurimonas sp.]